MPEVALRMPGGRAIKIPDTFASVSYSLEDAGGPNYLGVAVLHYHSSAMQCRYFNQPYDTQVVSVKYFFFQMMGRASLLR